MPDTSAPTIAAAPADVVTMFAILQRQLEDTRQQLFELANRKDPKDKTLGEVVMSYLATWPDDVTAQEPRTAPNVSWPSREFLWGQTDKRGRHRRPGQFSARPHPSWAAGCKLGRKVSQIKRAFNWAFAHTDPGVSFQGSQDPQEQARPPHNARRIPPAWFATRPRTSAAFCFFSCTPVAARRKRQTCILTKSTGSAAPHPGTPQDSQENRRAPRIDPSARPDAVAPLVAPPIGRGLRRPHWLAELLGYGSLTIRQLSQEARKHGITHRMVWKAKRSIGAELMPGQGQEPRYVLRRPPPLPNDDDAADFVFLNAKGRPWTKTSLDSTMAA